MADLAREVIARLSSQGVGSTTSTGYQLRARGFTASPDNQIAVTPSGGLARESDDSVALDRPRFQVAIRSGRSDSTDLEAKATAVMDALHHGDSTSFAGLGRVWYGLEAVTEPTFAGWDEDERPWYSINFQAWRSRTT